MGRLRSARLGALPAGCPPRTWYPSPSSPRLQGTSGHPGTLILRGFCYLHRNWCDPQNCHFGKSEISTLPTTELLLLSVMCTVLVSAPCFLLIGLLISLSPSQAGTDGNREGKCLGHIALRVELGLEPRACACRPVWRWSPCCGLCAVHF